ncbi:MAG TPA: bifunctional phosphoribosylaminoimidazolecarboxamide formyltransferase/IMP cyclohydrolase [Longimicrobiales bacterium]|nr:bifunctional phosphoribosylaminoimidazolecarboxamide formyltransferase/IMP cyclohydrolase [Longimicrobiales bacterium]
MPRALLSVSDKTGIVEFARGLGELGWELISTGGTASLLRESGLDVRDVSEVTRHPEMMDGRVKTLHPAVHAGILARRDVASDMDAMAAQRYAAIDMVVVNLYPFHEAVAAGSALRTAMEKVDIGGPTMLRAAAKNHAHVMAVVDPADYDGILAVLKAGEASPENGAHLRQRLAAKVFAHTAAYDAAIAEYFSRFEAGEQQDAGAGPDELPASLVLRLDRVQGLRYGENPDQRAAFYADEHAPAGSVPHMRQLHGKELSFNNLLDVDAATAAISAWAGDAEAACVIIKHTTPCGVAVGGTQLEAWQRALASDPVSAFGGIVAFNRPVDAATAAELAGIFLEIIVAPGFEQDALERLTGKKNLRLIALPAERAAPEELDYKRVRGGFLVQSRMSMDFQETDWRVVTERQPEPQEMADLRFAWRACASVKSNAIVIARDGRTLGIGAGQMSRVDSSRIAVMKAQDQRAHTDGAALASDAFFPFRDGIDAAAQAGIRCVIQPGGSVRDEEVIAAADEHGMTMIFTGRRVFRH